MTKKIEDELRELFGSSVEGFDMDGTLPTRVRKRARARALRTLSAVVAVAVLGGALSVVTLRGHPAGQTATSAAVPGIRLMNYVDEPYFPDSAALKEQIQCLRDQGFDVPDPVSDGNRVVMQLPSSIDQSSLTWREALFVTCAMSKFWDQPPPAGLEFVAPTEADAQALLDCMQAQGFDLPAPTQQGDGRYLIDLSTTSIDTTSDAWNQALLISCAPPTPPWPPGPSGPSGPSGGFTSGSPGTGPTGPSA